MNVRTIYILRPPGAGGVSEVCDSLESEFRKTGRDVYTLTSHWSALLLVFRSSRERGVAVVSNVSYGLWGMFFSRSCFIIHGFPFCQNMSFARYLLNGIAHRFFSWANTTSVAVSEFTRYTCQTHLGFTPNAVIGNMVPASFIWRGTAERKTAEVIFIGRLVSAKGIDAILAAISDLRRTRRVVMHVVGDGEMRPSLEADYRHSDTHFHGFVAAERKYELLRASTVFISMCEGEPFGLTSLEAYLCGAKLVLPSFGGHMEFVPADRMYRVSAPRDPLEIARQISSALDSPSVEVPDQSVALRFSARAVADAYLAQIEAM